MVSDLLLQWRLRIGYPWASVPGHRRFRERAGDRKGQTRNADEELPVFRRILQFRYTTYRTRHTVLPQALLENAALGGVGLRTCPREYFMP